MATLIYKGPGCRRLVKGTMITVVPKSGHSQIESDDIGNALKRLGLENDEVKFGSNTKDWETPQERESRMRLEASKKKEYESEQIFYDTDSEEGIIDFFKRFFWVNLQITAVVLLGVPVACSMRDTYDLLTFIACVIAGLYLPFKGLNSVRGGDLSHGEVIRTFLEIGKEPVKEWWRKYYAPNSPKSKTFVMITAVLAAITICMSFVGKITDLQIVFIVLTIIASPLYYTLLYIVKGRMG